MGYPESDARTISWEATIPVANGGQMVGQQRANVGGSGVYVEQIGKLNMTICFFVTFFNDLVGDSNYTKKILS